MIFGQRSRGSERVNRKAILEKSARHRTASAKVLTWDVKGIEEIRLQEQSEQSKR